MNISEKDEKSLQQLEADIKKLEKRNKNKQSTNVTLTPEDFNLLVSKNKVPKDVKDWYLNDQYKRNKQQQDFIQCMNDNQHIPEANRGIECLKQSIEEYNALALLNPQDNLKEAYKTILNLDQLFEIFSLSNLESELNTNLISPLFKKNIDHVNAFGVTKALTDRIVYFLELPNRAQLKKTPSGAFIIRAELASSEKDIGTIGLEHDVPTKDPIEAEKYLHDYIKCMVSDALPVLLAYWAEANDERCFNYLAPLTNVMKHNFDNINRKPSINERRRFWELSKMLTKTELTFDFKIDKEYIKTTQPLLRLDITASKDRNQEINKGYPDKVHAKVLDPNIFQKAATLATEISRGTLKLRGEDIMLAFSFESRASQTRSKSDLLKYNEEQLMIKAGLIGTYNANPRVARQRLKEKFKKILKAKSIDAFQEHKGTYTIKKRPPKK